MPKKTSLPSAYVRGNMVIPLEDTMDTTRTLYFHACEDESCPGKAVVEYSPAITAGSAYRPELSDRPPCPVCGGEMKMVTMNAEEQSLIPDPGWPEQIQAGMTLYTRTFFVPTVKKKVSQASPHPPEQLKELTEGFFTDDDLAKVFGVTKRVVSTWVRDGRIRPVKLTEKKKRLYTKQIIEDFVDRNSDLLSRQSPVMGQIPAPRPRKSMSVEESRDLVKSMRRKLNSKE